MDADRWAGFEVHRSFIIAGRRLRETQIGSGSTEQEKEGMAARAPLPYSSGVVCGHHSSRLGSRSA